MDNTVGSLTSRQKSIVIGTLLGDGYLRRITGRKNAFLEINHSYKQKDYVLWKYENLKEIVISGPKIRKYQSRTAYRFYTKQSEYFSKLLDMFYFNGKKIIPDLTIDPLSLAVWYMDDGSKSREDDVYLNTQQFSLIDQRKLIEMLKTFGLEARLNKDKQYHRIRFLKSSLPRFRNMIKSHIIESMYYKI